MQRVQESETLLSTLQQALSDAKRNTQEQMVSSMLRSLPDGFIIGVLKMTGRPKRIVGLSLTITYSHAAACGVCLLVLYHHLIAVLHSRWVIKNKVNWCRMSYLHAVAP